jgi:predicted nucleic acid-binding protein
VDTNVLVYAHDRSAGDKHDQAKALMRSLWDDGRGCLSMQVLQEFYVNITRKVPRPLGPSAAAEIIADLATWDVHCPNPADMQDAIRFGQRHGLAFWDAMILTSAQAKGCPVVWSEDLNAGQDYGGVRVVNPLSAQGTG